MVKDSPKAAPMRLLSSLVSRAMLAWRAGTQFGGSRDLYQVFGYKTSLEFEDFLAKYIRDGMAKRVINAYANSTWAEGAVVKGGEPFDAQWKELVRNYHIWNMLQRLDKLCGLGRYAVLLVGFDDGASLETPVTPVTEIGGVARKVIYLQPYTEKSASILKFVTDTTNPRFGLPEIYEINLLDPAQEVVLGGSKQRPYPAPQPDGRTGIPSIGSSVKVHHSRVLHVAEDLLENNVFGIPRLSAIFNYLDDLLKVSGGSSENYWLSANRGVQVDVDKEIELTPEDAQDLSDEIEQWQHELRRFVRTRGVKINPLKGEFVNSDSTFRMLVALISGATGIPQRVLLGSEVGQLASEQDRANWADRVQERRADFAEPHVLLPLIKLLADAGALPQPQNLEVEWPRAFKMSPLERAQESAQFARSVVNLSKQADSGFPIVSLEEAREGIGLPAKVSGTLPPPPKKKANQAGGSGNNSNSATGDDDEDPMSEGNSQNGGRNPSGNQEDS